MAFSHGKDAILWLNGFKLSAYLRSIALGGMADLHDSSVFELADKTYIAGKEAATLSLDGLFDGVASAIDDRLKTLLGSSSGEVYTYLPAGDGLGKRQKGLTATQTQYNVDTPSTDLAQVHVEAASEVGYESGTVLHAMGAETADGNGTDENTAATTTGAAGYAQISAVAGTGSIDLFIQDSADGATWADLITFVSVAHTEVPTAQRVAVTGTVRAHLRARWDLTTITSVTFLVAVARK